MEFLLGHPGYLFLCEVDRRRDALARSLAALKQTGPFSTRRRSDPLR
jgi:hypothetical protein